MRRERQGWNRTGKVPGVTPWAQKSLRAGFQTEPRRTVRLHGCVCAAWFSGRAWNQIKLFNFHQRTPKLFNPSACQSDPLAVSMVSKNKEPGVAFQHRRSRTCFNGHSGKIRMFTQRRRPEVKSNKRPFAPLQVEEGMFSSLR